VRNARAVALALALAILIGIAVALAVSGGGAPKPRSSLNPTRQATSNFGADVSAMFLNRTLSGASVDRELAGVAADGLGLVRAAPLWEFTEPQAPRSGVHTYDWRFDDFIDDHLAAHGLKWIAVLGYTPGWASLTPNELHGAPRTPGDFAAYAGALASRYRGRIVGYEIWNEENSGIFWRPRPDPAAYASLYLAARAAIHAADPGVPVLVGGLANGTQFLPRLLSIPGFAGQIDGIAVHPYGANPTEVVARVRGYRAELRSLGAGEIPLYVTEYGWATQPAGNPTYATAAQQGPYIDEVARMLLRSDCGVRDVIFYAWTTAERKLTDRDQWYGIAAPTGTPTPATASVAETASSLAGSPGQTVQLCGA
jgi:hypothetical protein